MNIYLKKQNFRWKKIAFITVGLILFLGFLTMFQAHIKNSIYVITSPLLTSFSKTGKNTSGFFASFLNAKGLNQENSNLKEENQQLLSQITILKDTLQANQAWQLVAQSTQNDNFNLLAAESIGVDTTGDFMLINKGSNDNIAENMPVISSTKVLFGKVVKVYKNFSQVMLISNKNSVVDVKIPQNDPTLPPILGAIKGSGSLALYLDLVSSEALIANNDTLVTSGQEGIFPKDLLVGKIESNSKNDLKPFQTAQVKPFFDINNMEHVFVITDYKQEK